MKHDSELLRMQAILKTIERLIDQVWRFRKDFGVDAEARMIAYFKSRFAYLWKIFQ